MPINLVPPVLRASGESTEGLGHENQIQDIPEFAKPNKDRGAVGIDRMYWNARMLQEGGPDVFINEELYCRTQAQLAAEDAKASEWAAERFGPVTIVKSLRTQLEERTVWLPPEPIESAKGNYELSIEMRVVRWIAGKVRAKRLRNLGPSVQTLDVIGRYTEK